MTDMEQSQIFEGNKLLAVFMGFKPFEDSRYGTMYSPPKGGPSILWLQYHTSWDWIMQVVEKMESLHYWVNICLKECTVTDCNVSSFPEIVNIGKDEADTKIEAVWLAVVAFVKWYNKTISK